MSIVVHDSWDMSDKSQKDTDRHKKKIDDAIREGAKDLIAEESIITKKRSGTVKIPVRGLKDYRFKHGTSGKQGGVGSGKGGPGDIIGRKPKQGQGGRPGQGNEPGKPGQGPGEDYLEVEIDIDYLVQIMFEDLGLPFIEEKSKACKLVTTGYDVDNIDKRGIDSLIHKQKTIVETIKRMMGDVGLIMEETGVDEDDARRAYVQSEFEINEAIDIILQERLDPTIDPDMSLQIEDDDLRYRQIIEEVHPVSNAVIFFMCDTSGSMDTQKKYLARSLSFWMYEFIKSRYNHVEARFITHTTEAKLVDEDEFFRRGESGGTSCHTAFDLAEHLIDTEYPINEYNVYIQYFSDGEDFDTGKTCDSIKRLIEKKLNMICYCEIQPQAGNAGYMWSNPELLDRMKGEFKLVKTKASLEFYRSKALKLYAGVVKDKKHIYEYLKNVLFKE